MVKEEVDEVKIEIIEIKAKWIETGGGVKEETRECMNMLYLQRDKVLKDQAKRMQVLETNREEVSTVKVNHGETGHVHDANWCVSSLGGNKGPGVSCSDERHGVCAEYAESKRDGVRARNEWCGVHEGMQEHSTCTDTDGGSC